MPHDNLISDKIQINFVKVDQFKFQFDVAF